MFGINNMLTLATWKHVNVITAFNSFIFIYFWFLFLAMTEMFRVA